MREISKQNCLFSIDEIFKMWKIDLSQEQAQILKNQYFEQAWDLFVKEEDGMLDLKDAYRFTKDLMTLPIIKKPKA